MERRPIFDAVRQMLGRGLRGREVAALDGAIDAALGQAAPPAAANTHALSPAGLALIQRWEGCAKRRSDGRYEAYPDPGTGADPWTIGWGTTGSDVVPGLVWTLEQCNARFERDVQRFVREVQAALAGAPTSQGQFDAMVSFHYNTGAIRKATLTRLHKAGDHAGAAAEFGKWVHAGGQRLTGLVRRRADEAALYRSK